MDRFAAHAAAQTAHLVDVDALADVEFTIEQRITEADGTLIESYQMILSNGSAEVLSPGTSEPDLTITQDEETAEGLRSGRLHAQSAFLTGQLKIDGDINRLLEHRELFTALLGPRDA